MDNVVTKWDILQYRRSWKRIPYQGSLVIDKKCFPYDLNLKLKIHILTNSFTPADRGRHDLTLTPCSAPGEPAWGYSRRVPPPAAPWEPQAWLSVPADRGLEQGMLGLTEIQEKQTLYTRTLGALFTVLYIFFSMNSGFQNSDLDNCHSVHKPLKRTSKKILFV